MAPNLPRSKRKINVKIFYLDLVSLSRASSGQGHFAKCQQIHSTARIKCEAFADLRDRNIPGSRPVDDVRIPCLPS